MPASRRRGALAVLSMFGKVKKEIVLEHKDDLLKFGLGEHAKVCALFFISNIKLTIIERMICFWLNMHVLLFNKSEQKRDKRV
jgi:hypothetical protein